MECARKDNKGFTLVELVVVMVILCILSAILVPATLSYIDEQNYNTELLNAKSMIMVSQTVVTKRYDLVIDHSVSYQRKAKDVTEIRTKAAMPEEAVGWIGMKGGTDRGNYTVAYGYYENRGYAFFFDGDSWTDMAAGSYNPNSGFDRAKISLQ
ncbi:MAG: type II secretion system GspH family protein, partial [Eubacterium sp.]|nr:type II secretion system GspH family protein [Eubacterium sp.]